MDCLRCSLSLCLLHLGHAVLGAEEWNPWEVDEKTYLLQRSENSLQLLEKINTQEEHINLRVQIWGKAAIGKHVSLLLVACLFTNLVAFSKHSFH